MGMDETVSVIGNSSRCGKTSKVSFMLKIVRKVFRVAPWNWLSRTLTFGLLGVFRVSTESAIGSKVYPLSLPPSSIVRARWSGGRLTNLSEKSQREILSYREIDGVYLSANSRGGFLRRGHDLFTPEVGFPIIPKLFYPNTRVAGIYDQKDGRVLARPTIARGHISEGIFVGSMAPHNWFHWIIDVLPSVYFARHLPPQYSQYPLLLPQKGVERSHWREALDIVKAERDSILLDPSKYYRVSKLIRLDSVTRPAPRPLGIQLPARISVLSHYLLEYRDYMLARLHLDKVGPISGRKTFIARRPGSVRNYNQAEISELLDRAGFTLVYLEDLSFRKSVQIFRESEVLVGPHGAGWANMLFSSDRARVVMWTWPNEIEENWYENLAAVAGVGFHQIHTHPLPGSASRSGDPRIADYYLDPRSLELSIEAF